MNKKCIGFSEMTRAIDQGSVVPQTAYSGYIKFGYYGIYWFLSMPRLVANRLRRVIRYEKNLRNTKKKTNFTKLDNFISSQYVWIFFVDMSSYIVQHRTDITVKNSTSPWLQRIQNRFEFKSHKIFHFIAPPPSIWIALVSIQLH